MGNVACCKKPNEIIEDKDLLKKVSIKKDMRFTSDNSNFLNGGNPFLTTKNKQTNDLTSKDGKQIVNLENNIDYQEIQGPSDNMRKKKTKNIDNSKLQLQKEVTFNTFSTSYKKTQNEFDQTKSIMTTELNKEEDTKKEFRNNINNKDNNQNPKINKDIRANNLKYLNNNKNITERKIANNNQEQIDLANMNKEKYPTDRNTRRLYEQNPANENINKNDLQINPIE